MKYGIGEEAHLFALNPSKPSQVEIRLEMNAKVEPDIVKKAIEKVIKIFTRMKYKPVIETNGDLNFIVNDESLPIFRFDDKVRNIGSSDSNHYMFCVLYDDNNIILIVNHFISDGIGLGLLLNYFVYQYICIEKNEYYDDEIVKMLEDENNTSKDDLVADKLIDYAKKYHKEEFEDQSFKLFENDISTFIFEKNFDIYEGDNFYESIIEYDVSDMKTVIKKLDISPLMLFSILFNDVIIELKNVKEEMISVGVLANLRKFLKSNSIINFAAMSHLEYLTKWHSLSLEEKIEHVKEAYKETIDYEQISVINAKLYNLLIMRNEKPNINTIVEKRKNKIWRQIGDIDTYVLTNIGNIAFSEQFKEKVEDVSFYGSLISLTPVLLLFSYKNKGIVQFAQNVSDDSITKMVSEKMNSFGIKTKFIKSKLKHTNRCDALLFEKV